MKKIFNLLIFAVALTSSGMAVADDAGGHCNYMHDSVYADEPFKICAMPTDPADCEEIGNGDNNSDAVYSEGACPSEGAVGTCDTGDSKLIYYNGDSEGLEIGCGFQNGEWENAE